MQYRVDNKSGKNLSVLGFGVMRFPTRAGRIIMEKAEPLLLHAYEQGINYFDTAYLYGSSEATLGEVFEKHGIRNKVFIATKLPQGLCKKSEDIDKYFSIELERLRTDYIDYYLMHNMTELKQWEHLCELGIKEWIAEKKESGAIRQLGFSFHGSYDEYEKLIDAYDWDFVQIQYNYVNENYQAGVKGLKLAAEKGLPVIIMEPLLGGRLTDSLPQEAINRFKSASPESTPASWGLRWIWDQPEATVILSGMNTMEQLEENIALAETSLPNTMTDSELGTIREVVDIFNESYKIRCTGCNYCMPCPKEINIPDVFAAYNASYSVGKRTGVSQYINTVGMLSDQPHFVSDCVECGKCVGHCPQNIDIPNEMKEVRRRLQFRGMPTVQKVVKKFMR